MISITEESEMTGTNSNTTESLGMRNNLVRSSKEILKTHKVPFPGFKKKDKDKEKDKSVSNSFLMCAILVSSKGRIEKKNNKFHMKWLILKDGVNATSGAGTGSASASNVSSSTTGGTKTQSKNGNITFDSMKDSMIIAATKQLTKKDKRGSTVALQAASVDISDASMYLEKASPSLQIKRKSSSVEVTSNGPINSIDMVPMSSFANGNPVINEEGANGDYSAVDINTTETNSDLSSINNSKPATTATTNNNIQISQV